MKILLGHFFECGIERRHHGANDHAANRGRRQACQRKQLSREDAVFVDGLIARRRQTPVRDQFFATKQAQDRVGVSDVQRKQHQYASVRLSQGAGNYQQRGPIISLDAQQTAGFKAVGGARVGFL